MYRARMNSMGLMFMEVHHFGQSFVLISKGNNLGLSLCFESICPIHTIRNCAGNVLATWWQPTVVGNCHHIALIVNDRQYVASTLSSIVNACQTTETLGDFLELFKKIAVVASIVNELLVSLQQFWQCCKRSPIHLHQVVNDLRSQPGNNVVATFGNSVTTVGDSVETIGGVCDINCIIFWKMCVKKRNWCPHELKITVLCSLLMQSLGKPNWFLSVVTP